MPSRTLYLVRHGEAGGHDETDPGLTDHGRRQATAAGHALRDIGAGALLHSSRRRARETAAHLAMSLPGIPVVQSHLVEDRTPVPDEWTDVPSRYHEFLRRVPADEADPGGRMLDAAVRELASTGREDDALVIVTHNFVIGWIVRSVLDAPWWRWIGLHQDHGAITIVEWSSDRPARLITFNERHHLPDPAS